MNSFRAAPAAKSRCLLTLPFAPTTSPPSTACPHPAGMAVCLPVRLPIRLPGCLRLRFLARLAGCCSHAWEATFDPISSSFWVQKKTPFLGSGCKLIVFPGFLGHFSETDWGRPHKTQTKNIPGTAKLHAGRMRTSSGWL